MVQNGPAAGRRRREILGAASRLFRERGLHATGMREIAASLGRTAGNLYYYFPSKQDLLAYCQEQTLGQLRQRARAIRRMPVGAAEKLRKLIEGHVAVLNEETPGSLAHLEVNEVPPARRSALLAKRRAYEAAIRELIEEGVETGEFREVDSRLATLALLGALNWTVKWFQPDGRKTAAEVGIEFADLLLAGLLRRGDAGQRQTRKGKGTGSDRSVERPRARPRSTSRSIPAGGGGGEATAAQGRAAPKQRRSSEGKGTGSDRFAEGPRARPRNPSRRNPAGGGRAEAEAGTDAAQRRNDSSHLPLYGSLRDEADDARSTAKRPDARRAGASTEEISVLGKKRH